MGKTLRRFSNIVKNTGLWTEYTQEGDEAGLLGVRNSSDKRHRLNCSVDSADDYGAYYEDREKYLWLVRR